MKKTTMLATCVFLVSSTLTFLCSCGDETDGKEASQSTEESSQSTEDKGSLLTDKADSKPGVTPVPERTEEPSRADPKAPAEQEVGDVQSLAAETTGEQVSDESSHEGTMIAGKMVPPSAESFELEPEPLLLDIPVVLQVKDEANADDLNVQADELTDSDLNAADSEGAQALLEDIDQKNRLQKTEIDKLKNALVLKEKRIREYRILNEELKQRLRQALDNSSSGSPPSSTRPPSVSELEKKVASLTHEVGMANKERYEYQEQIRALQAKLDRMQAQSNGGGVNTDLPGRLEPIVIDDPSNPIVIAEPRPSGTSPTFEKENLPRAGGRLYFEAAITDAGGKTREAFYTEFFIVKQHLDDILAKAGFKLSDYEGIKSYAELWARVRKNDFQFRQQQQRIRQALLAAVDPRNGRRVFTDINGNADPIAGLPAGSYFIVGTAPLGQVGVTWSLLIEIEPYSDKRVALTLKNSSWSL